MWSSNREILEMLSTACLKKLRNYVAKVKDSRISIEEIEIVIADRNRTNGHPRPNTGKSS